MAIGPKGPPQKPGLSIRGRVIFDTVRGVPRVRPWPPKKPTKPGSKRNLTAKAFGAANRACKVTASVFYGEHWAATRGTPLLPRDLMIAMMYGRAFALKLDDGRIIRSMASRNDVSTSLDMISSTPGAMLKRGEKYWEAGAASGGGTRAMMYLDTDKAGVNLRNGATLSWQALDYDTGGFADFPTEKEAFIVPDGVFCVQLFGGLRINDLSTGDWCNIGFNKNDSADFPGNCILRIDVPITHPMLTIASPPILCEPGDAFTMVAATESDQSVTLRPWVSYFAIREA